MDWSGVLPTLAGGGMALGGSYVAHRWTDRTALRREQRDWMRAVDERSFNSRSCAYVDFLHAARTAMATATGGDHAFDQQAILERRLSEVELLGSDRAYTAARDLLRGIVDYELDLDPHRLTRVHELLNQFVNESRKDLGLGTS